MSVKIMHNDYDLSNKVIMEKYNVKLPSKINDRVDFKNGEMKLLTYDIVDRLVEQISNLYIDDIAEEIKTNPEKWTKMKKLKRIDE